jgi:hypothetical protein
MADLLPKKYYDHFLRYVECCRFLTSMNVTKSQLPAVQQKLRLFVKDTQALYGPSMMTFNVHQMLHLTDTVKKFGPLGETANFQFVHFFVC